MHIHILGICGTFMGSLALLARDLGHKVTGSDANVYPPMSTQLENSGVEIMQGYCKEHLGFSIDGENKQTTPDLIVVGNTMKRGIEAVEYMLDEGIKYTSGPQFLSEQVLQSRHVLAVAGTHGKTTTTTMLAWALQYNNIDTGFLIGGVPIVSESVKSENERLKTAFAHSSHLGSNGFSTEASEKSFFVIEADEYDSAFFDKRSKFVHYHPCTAILNNLEFDHADIFADLNAIQTQFHHMIRMIPSSGRIVMPSDTESLEETIDKGCWTPIWRTALVEAFDKEGLEWQVKLLSEDGSHFSVQYIDRSVDTDGNVHTGEVNWGMSGLHNVNNGLMAIVASVDVGISVEGACEALSNFAGIKRRMELIGDVGGVKVYDDFAHHPTAIRTTLDGAKKKLTNSTDGNSGKLWAIIEPRSNTMKMGIHRETLAISANLADEVLWYEPAGLEWGLSEVISGAVNSTTVDNQQSVLNSTDDIIKHICDNAKADDVVVIMSNGAFEGIHGNLMNALSE